MALRFDDALDILPRTLSFEEAMAKYNPNHEEAATRAVSRFLRGGPAGRYVPVEVILGSTTNEKVFDKLSPSFDKWAVYDNNTPGGTPKLIAQGGK